MDYKGELFNCNLWLWKHISRVTSLSLLCSPSFCKELQVCFCLTEGRAEIYTHALTQLTYLITFTVYGCYINTISPWHDPWHKAERQIADRMCFGRVVQWCGCVNLSMGDNKRPALPPLLCISNNNRLHGTIWLLIINLLEHKHN